MKCDTYCLLVLWPLIFLFASKLAIEASHETLFAAGFAVALIVLPIRKLIVIVLARHFSYLCLRLVAGRGGLDCIVTFRKSNYCQLLIANGFPIQRKLILQPLHQPLSSHTIILYGQFSAPTPSEGNECGELKWDEVVSIDFNRAL